MSATGTLVTVGSLAGLYALLALALNIKFGETGILDFGHVAYWLVGAYVAVLIVIPPPDSFDLQDFLFGLNLEAALIDLTGMDIFGGLGWIVAIAIGIIAAGFLGLIVALPAIRLRADYLAIALLGVGLIAFRVVQSEGWLVNGPDNLRGYSRPFSELIPLPGSSPSAAILLGLVVMLIWLMILIFLVRVDLVEQLEGRKERIVTGLLWVASLGSYWAVRRVRQNQQAGSETTTARQYIPLYGITGLFAIIAMGLSIAELGNEAIMLFLGVGSVLLWVTVGLKVREHYREYDRRSAAVGLALALGFVVALTPTNQLVDMDGMISYVGAAVSFALLGLYGYAIYEGYTRWDRINVPGTYLGILGIGLLWILAIRYFGVPVINSSTIPSMIDSTLQNVFWLIDFHPAHGPSIDYRRFLMFVIVASVMASYFMLESLRLSPYGRVLRAVRDDENVAMSLGKNTFYFKVQAMIIGGAFAGLSGGLAAIYYRSIGYSHFNPIITFFIFLAVILGGKANNKGVILGAAMYWMLVRGTSEMADMFPGGIGSRMVILQNAIIGLLLVLILFYKPGGIWSEEPTIKKVTRQ